MERGIARKDVGMRSRLDRIAVMLALCVESCVERFGNFIRVKDPDVPGKKRIQRKGELFRRHSGAGIEMRDLRERMDAAVRSPGTLKNGSDACHVFDRFLDLLLDGDAVRLGLPAHVGGALIFYDQSDPSHILTPITVERNTVAAVRTAMKANARKSFRCIFS